MDGRGEAVWGDLDGLCGLYAGLRPTGALLGALVKPEVKDAPRE